jgi:hypothetical protein
MKRQIYRKWFDPDGEYQENYLVIYPNGRMIQLSFSKDAFFSHKAVVLQTSPTNPLSPEVFKKYKEVCLKVDYDNACRKAINLVKGQLILNSRR